MATQSQLLNQTLNGLARLRDRALDYSSASESEDDIPRPTNRGNKLKRKANLMHEGQIYSKDGPATYKRKINHAGYEVAIISKKPPRYDDDGELLEEPEINEEADADAALQDPYHGIEIDKILRPLTSAAELPNHPSLSAPYQSTILEGIINETSEMLYGERKALWHAKGLMTDLRGDGCWLPCGLFHTEQDESIFDTEALYTTDIAQEIKRLRSSSSQKCQSSGCKSQHKGHDDVPAVNGTLDRVEPIAPPANKSTTQPSNDIVMEHGAKSPGDNGTVVQDESRNQISDVRPVESSKMATNLRESHINESAASIISRQEISETSAASNALPSPAASPERHAEQAGNGEDQNVAEVAVSAKGPDATDAMDADGEHAAPQAVPHRMTTRAQAQAVSEQHSSTHTHTPSPSDSIPLFIHPLFLTPEESRPDQNFGLSPGEGEDTRILFSHYIQKQEEIVRGTEKLLHGLLRALRLRKNVYRWCKAESHVGEMSDGEDWYDMEEWGLDEPLRKGHDDEEEDPVQGKKTRARRAG